VSVIRVREGREGRERGGRERGEGMFNIKFFTIMRRPCAYTANMSTLKIIKKKKALTSLGFSRRC